MKCFTIDRWTSKNVIDEAGFWLLVELISYHLIKVSHTQILFCISYLTSITSWTNVPSGHSACDTMKNIQTEQTPSCYIMTEDGRDNAVLQRNCKYVLLFFLCKCKPFLVSFLIRMENNLFIKSIIAYHEPEAILNTSSKSRAYTAKQMQLGIPFDWIMAVNFQNPSGCGMGTQQVN